MRGGLVLVAWRSRWRISHALRVGHIGGGRGVRYRFHKIMLRAQPARQLARNAPYRAFASEKELKKRMSAVKTIIKITKSTKMIAAAKFKAAETAVFPAREIVVSCPRYSINAKLHDRLPL